MFSPVEMHTENAFEKGYILGIYYKRKADSKERGAHWLFVDMFGHTKWYDVETYRPIFKNLPEFKGIEEDSSEPYEIP